MNKTKKNDIRKLYQILKNYGYKKSFIKNSVFPDWWDDEILESPSGLQMARGYISVNLGLDYEELTKGNIKPDKEQINTTVKYKKTKNTNNSDLDIPTKFIINFISIISEYIDGDIIQHYPTYKELREIILSDYGNINLENMLRYCWNEGIAVVFITNVPTRKPQGVSFIYKNRPYVVLTHKRTESWLLFHLLHELGHIFNHHLINNEIYIDENINRNDEDEQEKQANEYAIRFLLGEYYNKNKFSKDVSIPKILNEGRKVSKKYNINLGSFLLDYAHRNKGRFGLITDALKQIGDKDAIDIINTEFVRNINWEDIPTSQIEFIHQVTSTEMIYDELYG